MEQIREEQNVNVDDESAEIRDQSFSKNETQDLESLQAGFANLSDREEIQAQYEKVANFYREIFPKYRSNLISLNKIILEFLPDTNVTHDLQLNNLQLREHLYHYVTFYDSFKISLEQDSNLRQTFIEKAKKLFAFEALGETSLMKELQTIVDTLDKQPIAALPSSTSGKQRNYFKISLWVLVYAFYFLMTAGKLLILGGNWLEKNMHFSRFNQYLATLIGTFFRFLFSPESLITKYQFSKNWGRIIKLANVAIWILIGVFFPILLAPLLAPLSVTLTAGALPGIFFFAETIGLSAVQVASAIATGIYMLLYNALNWNDWLDTPNLDANHDLLLESSCCPRIGSNVSNLENFKQAAKVKEAFHQKLSVETKETEPSCINSFFHCLLPSKQSSHDALTPRNDRMYEAQESQESLPNNFANYNPREAHVSPGTQAIYTPDGNYQSSFNQRHESQQSIDGETEEHREERPKAYI